MMNKEMKQGYLLYCPSGFYRAQPFYPEGFIGIAFYQAQPSTSFLLFFDIYYK